VLEPPVEVVVLADDGFVGAGAGVGLVANAKKLTEDHESESKMLRRISNPNGEAFF
jgi:hypothetical protein